MLDSFAKFIREIVGERYVDEFALILKYELNSCNIANHPYGFLVHSFPTLFNGYRVRIHTWRSGDRRKQFPDWPIHTHNADLHSYVIQGTIENRECEWADEVDGPSTLYVVGYSGQCSSLSRTKIRGRIRNYKSQTILEGNYYNLGKKRFHESLVSIDNSVSTLVLFSEERKGDAYVVGTSDGDQQYNFSRHLPESTARQRHTDYFEELVRKIL